MAWTNITDGQVDVKSPINETLLQGLRDNATELRFQFVPYNITENSTNSGTFVTISNFSLYVPSLTDDSNVTRLLTAPLWIYCDSGTANARLQDNASSANGTGTTTSNTTFTLVEPQLDIASAWKGTYRQINVQVFVGGGGTLVTYKAENAFVGRMVY